MRPLELALLVTTLVGAVRPVTALARRSGLAAVTATTVLAAAAAHVLVEGARWQLTPLYVAVVVVVLVAVADVARPAPPGPVGRWAVVGALAVLGGLTGWVLPVPSLPLPPGPQPVGTTVVALTDAARADGYGDTPADARRLVAQVWYPADPEAPRGTSSWVPAGAEVGRAIARWLGLPAFVLDHVGLVPSAATVDAPPTPEPGPLPLVVYVHGWGGFRSVQADLAEALASRGYVVAALDHTHGAAAAAFPDGTVVPLDPAALPEGVPQTTYDAAAERLVTTFSEDVAFLLRELEAGAVPSLTGRLDLGRFGVVGHSTGGGAAVRLCADEPRCAAVIGLDPWVEPVPDRVLGGGLEQPFLALRSDEWVDNDNDARLRRLRAASTGPGGLVAIAGTRHRDFTLLPYLTPLASQLGVAGDTPGTRTHAIVEAWTTRFLDAHLRDSADDPLADPPPFAEATVDG